MFQQVSVQPKSGQKKEDPKHLDALKRPSKLRIAPVVCCSECSNVGQVMPPQGRSQACGL
ncbi:Hypothetical protein FKW44_015904 [Caligus rogercresseyi]|uniref:Uncharacterized protein n=1 Tax=Caligus rogercresseyi TaxID=217165 RepID=A0A7T8H132_CALRO|nr:Hypothetical protein FKW44_015904 [Caligus rogercresseyi]